MLSRGGLWAGAGGEGKARESLRGGVGWSVLGVNRFRGPIGRAYFILLSSKTLFQNALLSGSNEQISKEKLKMFINQLKKILNRLRQISGIKFYLFVTILMGNV